MSEWYDREWLDDEMRRKYPAKAIHNAVINLISELSQRELHGEELWLQMRFEGAIRKVGPDLDDDEE